MSSEPLGGYSEVKLPDSFASSTSWERADEQDHRVNVETAKFAVTEATRLKKGAVRGAVLKPLEKKDYIAPKWGTLVIYPPEAVRREDDLRPADEYRETE